MSHAWAQAFAMVFDPYNLFVMLAASLFGLFVGAVPGLTATMATALLVPVTFFMAPVPAIAAIVTATAMAIFSGDIPGCLMRMPGTPASAAYTDEAYAMTKKGHAETALGAGLVFSALGGLFGTAVLMLSAPALAEFALKFSSFEYFWLVLLGPDLRRIHHVRQTAQGFCPLLLGLLVACVGLGNPAAFPRFTFGSTELLGGIGMIPMMIGMFAISEIIRYAVDTNPAAGHCRQADRQRIQGHVGPGEEIPGADPARQRRRHADRCAARGGCRHRGVDQLRDQQALLEGAREVRYRSRGGHRGIRLGQQQRARRCVDTRAGIRHPG